MPAVSRRSGGMYVSTDERPSDLCLPVTPSNSVDFANLTRGVYVGVGGDITAVIGGTAVLFTAVPQGVILPIEASRINATGTTASALVAMF